MKKKYKILILIYRRSFIILVVWFCHQISCLRYWFAVGYFQAFSARILYYYMYYIWNLRPGVLSLRLKNTLTKLYLFPRSPQTLIYKWRREDGQSFIKGTSLSDRNRVLTIPNAPMEAEGNYICTVTRPATSSRPGAVRSAVITLYLESKETI